MRILFDNPSNSKPQVSFVLLDWSCRESFHIFKYLNEQTVPRNQYEIIWIEYYGRQSPEIEAKLRDNERLGHPPILDQWIILDIPENIYYHKHLMYNVGIVAAKGKIVTICDADVMVRPSFVESFIKVFEAGESVPPVSGKGIVLHMDEVRNINKKHYPFDYPTFEELTAKRCINWKNGKTTGLLDTNDPLHTLNYGACMSALREDLIEIGGADEHIDYLGHICGPYEMTFRLVNAGRKEIWHQNEFLYHTWHPGTDGRKNYLGPHDGHNVSTTALAAKYSGRILPLEENPAIHALRLKTGESNRADLLLIALSDRNLAEWAPKLLEPSNDMGVLPKWDSFKILVRSFYMKAQRFLKKPKSTADIFRGLFLSSFIYIRNTIRFNSHLTKKCEQCLDEFMAAGLKEFALCGTGDVADILHSMTQRKPIKICGVYDVVAGKKFHGFGVLPLEKLKGYKGKVVIGTFEKIAERVDILKAVGVEAERVVVLL